MAGETQVVIEQEVVSVQIVEQQTNIVLSDEIVNIELREQYTPPVSNGGNGRVDKTISHAVNASLVMVELLSSNDRRNGVIIHNNSTAKCYVKYGDGAGVMNYSYCLDEGITLEMSPYLYTGIITAVWDGENGFAMVTEL